MKRIVFFLFCMLFSFSFSAPGKDRSFFFVQLSDPRLGLCSEDGGFEREKQQFKQFVDAINRLKPAFVVISGNLVNDRGNAAQLAGFRELCRRIDSKIPIYLLPGACDVGDEASPEAVQDFIGRYGSDRFVFRKEGCCVIGLNTPVVKAGNSGQRRQQYDWLEKQRREIPAPDLDRTSSVFCKPAGRTRRRRKHSVAGTAAIPRSLRPLSRRSGAGRTPVSPDGIRF